MANKEQASRPVHGISLASYLQVLEQEHKTSTLVVSHGNEEGRFYFFEGQLVDAEYGGKVGLAAAYSLLVWEDPAYRVTEGEDRMHRIKEPLAHILLNSATKKDDAKEQLTTGDRKMVNDRVAGSMQENPVVVRLIDEFIANPGVKHYCILGRQGKMIAGSSKSQKIADFISYSIISGIQMRQAVGAKALHRIKFKLKDEGMLLIIPSGAIVIGLLLNESASESEVFSGLRRAVAKK